MANVCVCIEWNVQMSLASLMRKKNFNRKFLLRKKKQKMWSINHKQVTVNEEKRKKNITELAFIRMTNNSSVLKFLASEMLV